MSQSAIVKTETVSNTLDVSLPEVVTFDYSRRLLTLTPEEKAKYLSIGQSIKLDDMCINRNPGNLKTSGIFNYEKIRYFILTG